MKPCAAWMPHRWFAFASSSLILVSGCAGPWNRPLRNDAHIRGELATEQLPPAPVPTALPDPPPRTPETTTTANQNPTSGTLELMTVLQSVSESFPLLYAVELERPIANSQLQVAESAFDTVVNSRYFNQFGSYENRNLDVNIVQQTPFNGAAFTAGYRAGLGNFVGHNGAALTADGGEFRFGVSLPLLRGGPIDSQRARVRAAQISQQLADPVIRRARLDFFLGAARAYWNWAQAGARYEIQSEFLKLAEERKDQLDERKEAGLDRGDVASLNEFELNNRQRDLVGLRRQLEQAAFNLSLFYRDEAGNPIVPRADQLPGRFIDFILEKPDQKKLAADTAIALQQRPELVRFELLRRRLGVDLQLALNDILPTLNATSAISQDVGQASPTLDRTNFQAGVVFQLPIARRDALGRTGIAQAQIVQTLLNERDARDRITAEVQDAISELVASYEQVEFARKSLNAAIEARDLEEQRFREELNNILELNILEGLAVSAENQVVVAVGNYLRAIAFYQTTLGIEANDNMTGQVLPVAKPTGRLPEVNRAPKLVPPAKEPKGPPEPREPKPVLPANPPALPDPRPLPIPLPPPQPE